MCMYVFSMFRHKHTHSHSCVPVSIEKRQSQHSHAFAGDPFARDTRYNNKSPPNHNRQLISASKDAYSHRQSTTPSSGNRSTSTQRDVHSAHEAMINDQMV